MRPRIVVSILLAMAAANAHALDFTPREFNVYLSRGESPMNVHGHSVFRSIYFEVEGDSPRVRRWIPRAQAGISISYSDIHQARSWFGYRYGDPDDWVRAVSSYFFVRRKWRDTADVQPYAQLGTGPMWSNRRVPAATSRFNFDSQLGLGALFFAHSRVPLHLEYRFAHISNAALAHRNPGLEVHSLFIGVRVFDFHRAGRKESGRLGRSDRASRPNTIRHSPSETLSECGWDARSPEEPTDCR